MYLNFVRKLSLAAVTFAAASFAFGAPLASADDHEKEFILGVPGAHSGDNASYGLTSLKTAKLLAKLYNQKGGLLGKEIKVESEDDQCKPELAINAANKLLSDNVDVIMGHTCSGATKAALPVYTNAHKIVMSPSATSPQLTRSGDYPTFFRSIASDDAQAEESVKLAQKLGVKKLAILHDKAEYGLGYATAVKEFAEKAGIEVVVFDGLTSGAVDYSAVIQTVIKGKADALMFGGYQPDASKIITQLRKKKSTITFISDDGVNNEHFIKLAGKYAEGVYAAGPKDISKNPMYKTAREEYRKEYHEDPGAYFDQSYAACVALFNAVEKAKSTDTEKVMQVLRTDYVETPLGKIRFDAHGEAEGVGFSMYIVKDGKFILP